MLFKEDGVDSLGEVWWGGPSRVGQFGEVQMGKFGPYSAVIEFFMRFVVWFGGLGWEVVIQC